MPISSRSRRGFLALAALAGAAALPRAAGAQEGVEPPMVRPPVILAPPPGAPVPVAPLPPLPPNIVTSPDGSVSVTRTPQQGVDVHAPTPAGTVHAYGCSRVDVDARTRAPAPQAAPCPYAVAYPYPYPYPYVAPPPPYYLPPPVYQPPLIPRPRPRYAPDPARKGALIASSLLFGLGTLGAGAAYVASTLPDRRASCGLGDSCGDLPGEPSKPALYTMGGFLTLTPSIPRLVVGDVGLSLLLTGLRGGSFAAGTLIDWKDDTYMLPVTFALIVPLTIGIVDLATTPHREDLEDKKPSDASAKPRLRGLGPTAIAGTRGELAPAVGALGTF